MTCGVPSCIRVLIEVANLFLVDSYRQDLFLFKFVGVILVTFDDHETMIFVQFDLRWHQKYLRKEVLLLEKLLVIWLFQIVALVCHRIYNNSFNAADRTLLSLYWPPT